MRLTLIAFALILTATTARADLFTLTAAHDGSQHTLPFPPITEVVTPLSFGSYFLGSSFGGLNSFEAAASTYDLTGIDGVLSITRAILEVHITGSQVDRFSNPAILHVGEFTATGLPLGLADFALPCRDAGDTGAMAQHYGDDVLFRFDVTSLVIGQRCVGFRYTGNGIYGLVGTLDVQAVPEPGVLTLACLAAGLYLSRRVTRRRAVSASASNA